MIAVVQFFGSWLRRSPSMRDREPARAGADNVGLREPPIMLAEVIAASSRGDDLAPRQCADASTQEMIQIDESTYCRLVIYTIEKRSPNRRLAVCISRLRTREEASVSTVQRSESKSADLEIRPLADRIGAQIENIRLSGDLPDAAVAAIEAALARYRVIFERFQMDLVMLGVVILGVVGFSLNTGASLLEARLLRWRDG